MTCAVLLFAGCDNFAQLPLLGALERPLAGRIKRHMKCQVIIITIIIEYKSSKYGPEAIKMRNDDSEYDSNGILCLRRD